MEIKSHRPKIRNLKLIFESNGDQKWSLKTRKKCECQIRHFWCPIIKFRFQKLISEPKQISQDQKMEIKESLVQLMILTGALNGILSQKIIFSEPKNSF